MKAIILFLACLAVLLWQSNCIKMVLYVSRDQGPQCLYHYLGNGEKYSLTVKSLNMQRYRVDVYRQQDNRWAEVYNKDVVNAYDTISKMSASQSTHMFCFSNSEPEILKVGVEFQCGLELGEGHSLPSVDDHNLLDSQISWMDKEKERIIEIMERVEGSDSSKNLKSSSGKIMLFLAILGVLGVVVINYIFFRSAKKTLKDRKLI